MVLPTLGLPTAITNQGSIPQTCPQVSFVEAISQLSIYLSSQRNTVCVHMTKTNQHMQPWVSAFKNANCKDKLLWLRLEAASIHGNKHQLLPSLLGYVYIVLIRQTWNQFIQIYGLFLLEKWRKGICDLRPLKSNEAFKWSQRPQSEVSLTDLSFWCM